MKIFTSQLSETKTLIASIKTAAEEAGAGKWLYIRDIETGDKRANFGLLLHGKTYILTDRQTDNDNL